MLDHAQEAVGLVQGKTRADLDSDRLLNLALVRLLEIKRCRSLCKLAGTPIIGLAGGVGQ